MPADRPPHPTLNKTQSATGSADAASAAPTSPAAASSPTSSDAPTSPTSQATNSASSNMASSSGAATSPLTGDDSTSSTTTAPTSSSSSTTAQAPSTTTTTTSDPPTTTTTTNPPTSSTTTSNPPSISTTTTTTQQSASDSSPTTTGATVTVSTQATVTVSQSSSGDGGGGTVTATNTVTGEVTETASVPGGGTSVAASLATDLVTTTFQSTVFVTTTNSAGQTVTSAPPFVTETLTSTGSDGAPSIVTIVAENPTPITSNNNATQTSQFFRNKGAVAGVFLIVGLAAASIVLFVFFYVRRRRRTQRLEHDTAVASTLAAAGYGRRPLDGDDEERKMTMSERATPAASGILAMQNPSQGSGGLNSTRPGSSGMDDGTTGSGTVPSTPGAGMDFDPYSAYGTVHPPPPAASGNTRRDGYTPARTSSPPPAAWQRQHTHSTSTSASSMIWGHGAKGSVGSHEPLLSGYYAGGATEPSTPALGPTLNLAELGGVPPVPPRDPRRSAEAARPKGGVDQRSSTTSSSVYSAEEFNPADDRPKLEVRNLPDGATLSDISREPSRRD